MVCWNRSFWTSLRNVALLFRIVLFEYKKNSYLIISFFQSSGVIIDLITACKFEFPPHVQISDLAKDFCKKLLRKSSDGRLKADEAIKHPFILVNLSCFAVSLTNLWLKVHNEIPKKNIIENDVEGKRKLKTPIIRFKTQIMKEMEPNSLSAVKSKKESCYLILKLSISYHFLLRARWKQQINQFFEEILSQSS